MTINNLIYSLSLVLILTSCEKSAPDPINVNTVDNEYDISISQAIVDSKTQYYLNVRSLEASNCLNSVLNVEKIVTGQQININILGNVDSANCQEGTVFTEKNLELPTQIGEYQIVFTNGELLSTSGTLTISNSEVNLVVENLGGLFFENQNLQVIPEYLMWGYFADSQTDSTTDDFLNEMMMTFGFGQIPFENLTEGDYSEFKVNSAGEIVFDDINLEHVTFAFNIEDELRWNKITTLLPINAVNLPRLKYNLKTWDGRVFAN